MTITRQDVQVIIDGLRQQILPKLMTRRDLASQADLIKSLGGGLQQIQRLCRQGDLQRIQLARQVAALEARAINLEQSIRNMEAAFLRTLESNVARESLQLPVAPDGNTLSPERRYLYKPA